MSDKAMDWNDTITRDPRPEVNTGPAVPPPAGAEPQSEETEPYMGESAHLSAADLETLFRASHSAQQESEQAAKEAASTTQQSAGSAQTSPAGGKTGASATQTSATFPKAQSESTKAPKDYTKYFHMCRDNLLKHLDPEKEFGISSAALYQAGAGLDDRAHFHKTLPDGKVVTFEAPALIFPTSTNSYVREQLYYSGEGNRRESSGSTLLFNRTAIQSREPIFVTRREIDCIAIAQEGVPALAIGTNSKGLNLFSALMSTVKPAQPLILALGMDPDSKVANAKLEKALDDTQIPYITAGYRLSGTQDSASALARMDRPALTEAVKKLTGYALNPEVVAQEAEKRAEERQKTEDEAQAALDEAARLAMQKQIDDYNANHDAAKANYLEYVANSEYLERIRTGYSDLDKYHEGGLTEGLYLIAAISSLGKTTFALQMCDWIARHGTDVLIFSLEMAKVQLQSKTVSRLASQNPAAGKIFTDKFGNPVFTAPGVREKARWKYYSPEQVNVIHQAEEEYFSQIAPHLYIHEGLMTTTIDDIKATVDLHIAATGHRPVVLVDYLQIISPTEEQVRMTDKQRVDQQVKALKIMSREKNIPVITVCSVNRMNYSTPISMEAIKESGGAEYSADVIWGLQLKGVGEKDFDVNHAKEQNPRIIEVKVLKNRDGRTGKTFTFMYYSASNLFSEACSADLNKASEEAERKRTEAEQAAAEEEKRKAEEREIRRKERERQRNLTMQANIAKAAAQVMKGVKSEILNNLSDSGQGAAAVTADEFEKAFYFLDLKQGAATAANIAKALNLRSADIEAFVSAHPDQYRLDKSGTVIMIDDSDGAEDPTVPAYDPSAQASGTQSAESAETAPTAPDAETGRYADAYGSLYMFGSGEPITVSRLARAAGVSEAEVKDFIMRHSDWHLDGETVSRSTTASASSGTADGTV